MLCNAFAYVFALGRSVYRVPAPHKGKNCMLSLFLTLTPGAGHCSDGGNAIFGSVCVCHLGHPLAHRAPSALSSCPRREAAPCSEPVVDATHDLAVQPDSSQLLCLRILHVQPGDRQEAAQSISNYGAASRWGHLRRLMVELAMSNNMKEIFSSSSCQV